MCLPYCSVSATWAFYRMKGRKKFRQRSGSNFLFRWPRIEWDRNTETFHIPKCQRIREICTSVGSQIRVPSACMNVKHFYSFLLETLHLKYSELTLRTWCCLQRDKSEENPEVIWEHRKQNVSSLKSPSLRLYRTWQNPCLEACYPLDYGFGSTCQKWKVILIKSFQIWSLVYWVHREKCDLVLCTGRAHPCIRMFNHPMRKTFVQLKV